MIGAEVNNRWAATPIVANGLMYVADGVTRSAGSAAAVTVLICVLASFQERATGGAARVLPKGTIGAAVMKFCAAAGVRD